MSPAVRAIFKKEFFSYFLSPMGYVFIIVFLLASNYLAFAPGWGSFFIAGQADLRSLFQFLPYVFVVMTPAVAMHLWAEERQSGTIELLFTLPVTRTEAIVGKFFAAWFFMGIALFLTFPFCITIGVLSSTGPSLIGVLLAPDWGVIMMGYFGAFLMAGSYLAIGNFFSVACKSQVVAFIVSLVIIGFFVMAGSPPALDLLAYNFPPFVVDFVESLSILNHYESVQKGVLELKDLMFYLCMILGWLFASAFLLEEVRAD
ncbi:ABC transporter permease [Candidatus Riflebacteria bacterium]